MHSQSMLQFPDEQSRAARRHRRREKRREHSRESARRKAGFYTRRKLVDPIDAIGNDTLAYIAGLIDGEGTITILGSGRTPFYPAVSVGMTHQGVIQWLAETLNNSTVKLNNAPKFHDRHDGRKPIFRYLLTGRRAQQLCRRLLPYLRVKAEQAALLQGFPWKRTGDDVEATRKELKKRIAGLNGRKID